MRKRISILSTLALASSLALAGAAQASVTIQDTLSLPSSLVTKASANGCDNSPGPTITLEGELTLGGVKGRLIFRNNEQGTHERVEDVTVDLTILEDGETIQFAKQPPQGGVGGNPHIFIQFYDEDWKSVSKPVYLGRCVQGLSGASLLFAAFADADVDISGSCSNSPGPYITLSGELGFGGINAKLIFANSRKLSPHVRAEAVEVGFNLVPGDVLTFAKQPPLGGVGGNPRIYFQFLSESGKALSDEIFVGRCVQLN
jgi:hypothetical protein